MSDQPYDGESVDGAIADSGGVVGPAGGGTVIGGGLPSCSASERAVPIMSTAIANMILRTRGCYHSHFTERLTR